MNRFEQLAAAGALSAGALAGGAMAVHAAEMPQAGHVLEMNVEGQALALNAPVMIGGLAAVELRPMDAPCADNEYPTNWIDNNEDEIMQLQEVLCKPKATTPQTTQAPAPPATEAPPATQAPTTQAPTPTATDAPQASATPDTTRPRVTNSSDTDTVVETVASQTTQNTSRDPQPTLGEVLSQSYPEVFSAEPFAWAEAPQYQVEAVDTTGMTDGDLLDVPQIWTPQMAQELVKKAEGWREGGSTESGSGSELFTQAFAFGDPAKILELVEITQNEEGESIATFRGERVFLSQLRVVEKYIDAVEQRAAALEANA